MSGILALYVAIHSPLRDIIAALFGKRPQPCYFVCGDLLLRQSTIESIVAVALIANALLAAWIVADAFDGVSCDRPLIFGLSAFAFVVVPTAALGGIASFGGTRMLRPPTGPLLAMLPAALVLLGSIWRGWHPHQPPPARAPIPGLVWFVGAIALGPLIISMLFSLVRPPDGGDAISYHASLATFLWRDGNLTAFLDRAPMTWALAYPASAELWYGLLGIAGGEGLADLGQLPFALLGALAVAVFARRLGFGRGAAYLAGAAFLLAPTVIMQSTTQANDIAGSALLMASIALACAPVASWTTTRFVWLGLGLGLVVTTKLALLPYAFGLTLFVIGAAWRSSHLNRKSKTRPMALRLLLAGLMFLLVAGPWWLRNIGRYGNPIYPVAIPLLGRGVVYSDFGRIDDRELRRPVVAIDSHSLIHCVSGVTSSTGWPCRTRLAH